MACIQAEMCRSNEYFDRNLCKCVAAPSPPAPQGSGQPCQPCCGDLGAIPGSGAMKGLGQTNVTVNTPSSSAWVPWVAGALAAAAVGGGLYYYTTHHHGGRSMFENPIANPTRKKTQGAYQAAIANLLQYRYGFSYEKAYAAVNDPTVGKSISWLFAHNYNVSYAAWRIHRAVRRTLYGSWRESGYMPLRLPKPPLGGWGAITPSVAPQAAE